MNVLTLGDFRHPTKPKRRRNRMVYSCQSCKHKKIKCDRIKPRCSACVERGFKICRYFDSSSETLQDSNTRNILQKKEDILDGMVYGERIISLEELWKKRKKAAYYGATSVRPLFGHFFWSLKEGLSAFRNQWKLDNKNASRSMLLTDLVNPSTISECFPSYEDTLSLLESYFTSIWYDAFPIVSRDAVISDFLDVFEIVKDKVSVTRINNCLNPKIALIMLIVEYSMQQNEVCNNSLYEKCDSLLNHATTLIFQGNTLKNSSLPTLQALILLRLHKKHNLRDNDGGDGSNGSLIHSLCVQMAINLGLHKDIDLLYSTHDSSHRKTLKNVWLCVIHLDCLNSLDLGVPLLISDGYFDPKILQREATVVSHFLLTLRFCASKSTGMEVIVQDIVDCIKELKSFIFSRDTKEVIKCFHTSNVKSYDASNYRNTLILNFKIYNAFTLLSHYYQLVSGERFYMKNDDYIVKFQNTAAKYTIYTLISVGGFFCSLKKLYDSTNFDFWCQCFLFAMGFGKSNLPRVIFSSIALLDKFRNKDLHSSPRAIRMSDILVSSIDNNFEENGTFDYRNPLILAKCVYFCIDSMHEACRTGSMNAKDYSTVVCSAAFEMFMASYSETVPTYSLYEDAVNIVTNGSFDMDFDIPLHVSLLKSDPERDLKSLNGPELNFDHFAELDDFILDDIFFGS